MGEFDAFSSVRGSFVVVIGPAWLIASRAGECVTFRATLPIGLRPRDAQVCGPDAGYWGCPALVWRATLKRPRGASSANGMRDAHWNRKRLGVSSHDG